MGFWINTIIKSAKYLANKIREIKGKIK